MSGASRSWSDPQSPHSLYVNGSRVPKNISRAWCRAEGPSVPQILQVTAVARLTPFIGSHPRTGRAAQRYAV